MSYVNRWAYKDRSISMSPHSLLESTLPVTTCWDLFKKTRNLVTMLATTSRYENHLSLISYVSTAVDTVFPNTLTEEC